MYHPYLLAIMSCIDGDDLLYKGDPGKFPRTTEVRVTTIN